MKTLELNNKARLRKLVNTREKIATLNTQLEQLKEEESTLLANALSVFREAGKESHTFDKYKISVVNTDVMSIEDEEGVISYLRTEHPDMLVEKVDRKKLQKLLLSGESIEGAKVDKDAKQHLRLSIQK